MSTSFIEWFRTISLAEDWISAIMELLIAVSLILLVVGTSSLFVAGAIYLSLAGPWDTLDPGQLFYP